tara:strand:- start:74 stop:253 length:180 start_codon:yes stop_codon:yes gene_type:complete
MAGNAHLSIQKTKKYKKYAGVAYKYGYTPGGPCNPYWGFDIGEVSKTPTLMQQAGNPPV